MTKWGSAIVIGASSGIGEAIARLLASQGTRVALVARRESVMDRIAGDINEAEGRGMALVFPHDVRDPSQVEALFQEITVALGGLDLVVYTSGIMPRTGNDIYDSESDLAAIETNFSGAVAWLNEASRRFAVQRSGTIVGISSIAGDRGRRGNPVYGATKAALNSYLESLRNRLAVKGVHVVTVKPGYVRTPLLGSAGTPVPSISAERAAREILSAVAAGRRLTYVPSWWRFVAILLRSIPAPIFERLPIP
jgi:decaprenylphospho-beta-D-erythro-pentofuranosid-2-ulose 2-reductase